MAARGDHPRRGDVDAKPEVERLFGAQACRDLAAALLEAARIIEAATLVD